MLQSYYVYRKIGVSNPYDPKDDYNMQNVDINVHNVHDDARVILDAQYGYTVEEIVRKSPWRFLFFEKRHCERSLQSVAVSPP